MMTVSREKSSIELHALKEGECKKVVDAAFRILETIGVSVRYEPARDVLAAKGCTVEGDMVKIPRELVEWGIQAAPSEVTLYSRDGEAAMRLAAGGETYFGTLVSTSEIQDRSTGEWRPTTQQDQIDYTVLCDSLDNLSWLATGLSATDAPNDVQDIIETMTVLSYSPKPVMYWAQSTENLAVEAEMFAAIAGGEKAFAEKPFAINLVCPMDPLVQPANSLEQIMFMAKRKMPFVYISGIAFGLCSPMSISSGLALGVASTLVGNLVAQLTCEGTPYVAAKFMDNVDLMSGNMKHGRPELILANVATVDIFNYLGLPCCVNYCSTDSFEFDLIASRDASLQTFCAQASGASMVYGLGSLGTAIGISLEKLLYNDQMISYARLIDGIILDEESFYFDEIAEVGPGSDFLASDSTLENMHDFYMPDAMQPRTKGQKETLFSELAARVDAIIAAGPKRALADEKKAELDAILAKARK